VFGGARDLRALPPEHHAAAERAHRHLARAERFALMPMLEVEAGLAWTSLLRGEREAALDHLERAMRITPHNLGLRRDALALYGHAGRLDDALEVATAIAEHPEAGAEDHFTRAGLLVAMERPAEAIAAYRVCLALAPDSLQARYNLGGLLRRQGRIQEALVELREAEKLAPDDRDTRVELALALAEAGDRAEAVRQLRRAIELDPDHPEAVHHLPGLIAQLESQ
jgi:tetratricopeptide (TPR) repeat protein